MDSSRCFRGGKRLSSSHGPRLERFTRRTILLQVQRGHKQLSRSALPRAAFCYTFGVAAAPRHPGGQPSRSVPCPQCPAAVAASSTAALESAAAAPEACDALIVGAGPAGLGTALLMARRQGWRRVVILEAQPAVDAVEQDKSYTYMIDGRGRTLTDEAGVTGAMEEAGVEAVKVIMTKVTPDGAAATRSFEMKDEARRNVWVPRATFLRVLWGGLTEAEREGRVRLLLSTKVTSIQLAPPSGATSASSSSSSSSSSPILVHARNTRTGAELSFAPRLLVGADGIKSVVREALTTWGRGAGLPADHFAVTQLDSPAAGLKYKVLPMPPNTPFRGKTSAQAGAEDAAASSTSTGTSTGGSTGGRLVNSHFGTMEGVDAPKDRAMRLGFLPVRDAEAPRTANIIKPAGHVVWSKTTGPQLRDFLQESFPQLDISAVMTDQQLEAAAKSRGGVFPKPQHMQHFTAVVGPQLQAPAESSGAAEGGAGAAAAAGGVALVGDAVHSFPPDLGQGVNSALMDVVQLMKALDSSGGDLKRGLDLYEARQAPEAAALAKLMVFGGPYQYNHEPLMRTLWGLNVLLRTVLSRLAPWLFSPATFVLVQRTELTYQEVLRRVHETTARIWALVAAVAAAGLVCAVKVATAAAAAAGAA